MRDAGIQQRRQTPEVGCAFAILAINTALIGLATASFTQGPYSSHEQELWYRYGSLAFLMGGVVAPAVALFAGRKSRIVIGGSVAWMAMTLIAFIYYVGLSSGGV